MLESHDAANPPLAVVNAPSSGMYRNVVPPALLPLLPSLQITPPHAATQLRPTINTLNEQEKSYSHHAPHEDSGTERRCGIRDFRGEIPSLLWEFATPRM